MSTLTPPHTLQTIGNAIDFSKQDQLLTSLLPIRAVRILALDIDGKYIQKDGRVSVASGCILLLRNVPYLCTCWHVVTGIDITNPLAPPSNVPFRSGLELQYRDSILVKHNENWYAHPSEQKTLRIELWHRENVPQKPLWLQDAEFIPNQSLAGIGLAQPRRRDVALIRLPESCREPSHYYLDEHWISRGVPALVTDALIVGYPSGYSAIRDAVTAIVLRRGIAATQCDKGPFTQEFLLDGPGAHGMSGSPIFVKAPHNTRWYLAGMYSGSRFPEGSIPSYEKAAFALGSASYFGEDGLDDLVSPG